MMRQARKELGMATSETMMVGDTMETDILGGVQMGYRTILVQSGGARREELANYAYQPDLVINSVADLDESAGLLHTILPTMNREDDTPRFASVGADS
jgi:NagD protein